MKHISYTCQLLALTLLLLMPCNMMAEDIFTNFSYAKSNSKYSWYGTGKKENYDVAIRLYNKSLTGLTITKVSIPMGDVTDVSSIKVWLSKSLNLKTNEAGQKINQPDIESQEAIIKDGKIEVTLNQPYEIGEEGVYVGYSFNVDQLNKSTKKPVSTVTDSNADGLYIHSSRTHRQWLSMGTEGCSPMTVTLKVKPYAASFDNIANIYGETNKDVLVPLVVRNHGGKAIKSIEYEYQLNGATTTKHEDFFNPIANVYDQSADISLTLPAIKERGTYPIVFKLTKVNGEDNMDAKAEINSNVVIFNKIPKHRAIVEEYTGAWCGNCPRGLVGMAVMNRLYPEDFISVSYHNEDAMAIMESDQYPNDVAGFPDAFIDRQYECDPYFGFSSDADELAIDQAWLTISNNVLAPAAIEATATLNKNKYSVDIVTTLNFASDLKDTDYKLEFMVLADSLHGEGEKWTQKNYYANEAMGTYPEPEFKQFTEGSQKIDGYKFNDVLIATSRLRNEDIALPKDVKADDSYQYTYSLPLNEITSINGDGLVQDINHLRVVVALVDSNTKAIVNGAKTKVDTKEASGIYNIKGIDNKVPKAYYDLSGIRHNKVQSGVNIVKTANGNTVKVVVK